MVRLPVVGGDDDEWGDLLNDFLEVSLDNTHIDEGQRGKIKPTAISDAGGQLTDEKGQPDGYASLDSNGKVPASELDIDKSSVGLDNVDNTSDVDKPISSATQTALDNRLLKAGDTMSGNLNMGGSQVTNLGTTTNDADAATKLYVDDATSSIVTRSSTDGSVGFRVKNLDDWYSKLSTARTSPVNVVVIADSISVLGGDRTSWPNMLDSMFSRYGVIRPDSGGTEYASGEYIPNIDSSEGTPTTVGMGGYASELSNGQTASTEKPMDAVTIFYGQQPTGGQLEVRDGGPSGTLLTTIDTSGAQKSSLSWTSADLGYGTHNIHVTAVCDTGETVILEAMYIHCGNRDKGVRIISAGRSGIASLQYFETPHYGLDLIENLQPDLVIVGTGTNDSGQPGGYSGTVPDLITAIRSKANCDIALWVPYINDAFITSEAAEGRQMAEDLNLGLIDASSVLGSFNSADDPDGVYSSDNIHPDVVLRRLIAQHVFAVLSGDPIGQIYRNYSSLEEDLKGPNGITWNLGNGTVKIGSFFGYPTFAASSNTNEYFNVGNPFVNNAFDGYTGASISLGNGTSIPDITIARRSAGAVSFDAGTSRGGGELKFVRAITTNTAAEYTLQITDQNRTIECNNSSAQEVTVPPNSSVAFPVGTVIYVTQYGTGQVSIAAGSGVTLNAYDNTLTTAGQYASLMLHKRATNEWTVTPLPLDSGGGGGSSSIPKPSVITEAGSARTLATSDAWDYIRLTNATECDITVPDNSDDPIPVGTQIYLRSAGTGVYTIVEDSAVTVNPPSGGTLVLAGDAALIKVATDEWDLIGATVAV